MEEFDCLPPKEHQFWQSPTNESAFVDIQELNREVPTHCWRKKKSEIGHIEEGKTKNFTLPKSTPCPKAVQLSAKRDLLCQWEHMSECLALPAVQDAAKEAHLIGPLHASSRILRCAAQLRGGEGLKKQ